MGGAFFLSLDVVFNRFGKDLAQGADHPVDVFASRDKWWRQLDNGVASIVRATDQPATEHLGGDEAAQETLSLVTAPRFLRRLVLDQLDTPEVAGTANVTNNRQVLQTFELSLEVVLISANVFEDLSFSIISIDFSATAVETG